MSTWITQRLLVGVDPPDNGIDVVQVADVTAAIDALRTGKTVWFADDDWDTAAFDILTGLGFRPETARRQIHFGRTGVLLPVEDFVGV